MTGDNLTISKCIGNQRLGASSSWYYDITTNPVDFSAATC